MALASPSASGRSPVVSFAQLPFGVVTLGRTANVTKGYGRSLLWFSNGAVEILREKRARGSRPQ
ncbi:uncharacterized protein VDAG_05779 [Verticillium dahliae VdLs.17]|uniref:Uncharacterized protein n=1 Tax=Verticillium dahliae (strain VdLs.17 / ATCC MYA-4575 / FGSC 10137) TaxID=498257 RepID=G2X6J7_VERDV|nr:uncharacterized protein VDAG_05779 [Verticillium dahliae VdLs.17]EGY14615.1 hypothetical protein VDAG_05779 [Verticillium dahliae VdLs.17]